MYDIGHVILGTHVPWSQEDYNKVSAAYATDPDFLKEVQKFNPEVSQEDLIADAENGELEWPDFVEDQGWQKEYHGGGDSTVAWIGVELGTFDVTEHFPLSDLTDLGASTVKRMEAKKMYDSLPQAVRNVLPAFGVYVVWSSS